MKSLILIRHGEFDEGKESLNERGNEQIKSLAAKIRGFEPEIYSSLGPRSVESAAILAKELGSDTTALDLFHSMDRAPEVLELLKQSNKNIVIVSRGEFITPFAAYFAKEFLRKDIIIEPIIKGGGIVFNCPAKEISYL